MKYSIDTGQEVSDPKKNIYNSKNPYEFTFETLTGGNITTEYTPSIRIDKDKIVIDNFEITMYELKRMKEIIQKFYPEDYI